MNRLGCAFISLLLSSFFHWNEQLKTTKCAGRYHIRKEIQEPSNAFVLFCICLETNARQSEADAFRTYDLFQLKSIRVAADAKI
jgi:hypothetical protein